MSVTCDIINTGSELTLGRTLNRHGAWIAQKLVPLGITVRRQVTVPDGPIIREEMDRSLEAADLVVVTGGLGPTHDDITREVAGELLGLDLAVDPATAARIAARLAARGRCMNTHQGRQAMVPAGATVLENDHGTAPGLWFGTDLLGGRPALGLVLLPGPPRELHPMFDDQVLPLVKSAFRELLPPLDLHASFFYGIGEGDLAHNVDPLLHQVAGLDVGYCAHSTGVMELRLVGCPEAVAHAVGLVRPHLGPECFSESSALIEERVVTLLAGKREWVAVAESCTRGSVLSRITDVPGASAVIDRGFVVYANRAKSELISVKMNDLIEFGSVSEPVARQMAEGALAAAGSDHALALTGVAGPGGGSERTPVGTAWIALASRGFPTLAVRERWLADRPTFKLYAGSKALDLLRRRLEGTEQPLLTQ